MKKLDVQVKEHELVLKHWTLITRAKLKKYDIENISNLAQCNNYCPRIIKEAMCKHPGNLFSEEVYKLSSR